jgi:tetratricopeptide (TPR) repeat protein
MQQKIAGAIALTMMFAFLAGCDPEALIKQKVPEPVQSVLTFGNSSPKNKVPLTVSVLEVVSPKKDGVLPTNEDTLFKVNLKPPGDKPFENPDVNWTLFTEGTDQVQLGQGLSVKRKLAPGKYRVQVTLTVKDQKVSQTLSFRQALMLSGKVVTTEGSPLPGVELDLWDLNDQLVAKTQSGNDGKFSLEFPSESAFRLMPSKKEYSFLPIELVVKYAPEAKLDFTAIKAEISDIYLADSEQSTTPVKYFCPHQEIFLKLKIKSESRPRRIEAQLVQQEKETERVHSFENLGEEGTSNPEVIKLRAPTFFGPIAPHYRLRLNVLDEKGNKFSVNARELYSVDMLECFRKKMAEAIALQQKGDPVAAAKEYTQLEEYYKSVADPTPFVAAMEKGYYNRGLAELSAALAVEPGDSRRSALLGKSVQDFNSALKIRKSDLDALFLRGVISHLSKSYEAASSDYTEVIQRDPQFPGALRLRALAYVGTGIKHNLLQAIQDFNDAIKLDPSNKGLRKSRAETLKAYAKSLKEKDESVVDTSQIPLPSVEEGLDLTKIRK